MKRWTLIAALIGVHAIALANGEVNSPNMGLPVPAVGVTTGPAYANDINSSLAIIDAHDHSPGNGVPITPAGLNINSDLTCSDHNLTNIRAARFFTQGAPLAASGADLRELYVSGAELYYNDGAGNQVKITQSGSVTGSAGTISGLPSGTASAAFVAANGTFQFLQATSTPANMDAATYVLRYPGSYPSPTGNFIALQAPSSLATGFSLTLPPTLPGTLGSWQTSDTSGNQSWTTVDNSTLQYSSNVVSVKNAGITGTQLAAASVSASNIVSATITGTQVASNIALAGEGVTLGGNPAVVANFSPLTNGLSIVRGIVASGGTVAAGEGFNVNNISTGVYAVAFTAAFADTPAVTVSSEDATNRFVAIGSVTASGFRAYVFDASMTPAAAIAGEFSLIAVGQRN